MNKEEIFLNELMSQADSFSYDPTVKMYDPALSANGAKTVQGLAQFDLKITRNTANIASALPVALFGAAYNESNYSGIISVTGGTLAITTVSDTTKRFTWTVGMNSDTIDVTCETQAYPAFLALSALNPFKIERATYSISDSSQQSQLSQKIREFKKSPFGGNKDNEVSVLSYRKSTDFLSGFVELNPLNIGIDAETVLTHNIINVAAFSVTLSMFVPYQKRLVA